jgi:hypothetical protein
MTRIRLGAFENRMSSVISFGAAIAGAGGAMTLTFVLTILGIWVLVSVPASILIASIMLVGEDPEATPALAVVPGTQKIA